MQITFCCFSAGAVLVIEPEFINSSIWLILYLLFSILSLRASVPILKNSHHKLATISYINTILAYHKLATKS